MRRAEVSLTIDEASELVGDDIAFWISNPFVDREAIAQKVCWWISTAALAAEEDDPLRAAVESGLTYAEAVAAQYEDAPLIPFDPDDPEEAEFLGIAAQEGERAWPACRTYPNLGCVCRGAASGNSGAPCLRKRTGDLTPVPLAAQEGEA